MTTNIYRPMTRLINELNYRVNNMPRYADQAFAFANSYVPAVNVEFKNVILTPRVDAVETDAHYTLLVELAGVAKEDVQITVEDQVLTIKGEKKRPESHNDVRFVSKGRRFGKFERAFKLAENVDAASISAEFANGILTLTLPKIEVKKPEPTTVEIK
ncbi:MAG: Hsp20/alpha crystallin family protein [Candidatus Kapaibacteriota bacterium]|jgi:HSP20 family protein